MYQFISFKAVIYINFECDKQHSPLSKNRDYRLTLITIYRYICELINNKN